MKTQDHACHADLPGLIPTARRRIATVVEQERMARDTYRIRLRCPELASEIVPGQFFMLRLPDETDPLLGRPFALYDTYEEAGEPAGVDFGYLVVGKLTRLMTRWTSGTPVELWGPLGNGFPVPTPAGPPLPRGRTGGLVMVAGGIGQTPFLAVAREALGLKQYGRPARRVAFNSSDERPFAERKTTLLYGARSAEYLAGLDDFAMPGLEVKTATDDGTAGHHGFVTDLLIESLESSRPERVYCCGPEAMMEAVADICAEAHVPCWASLETPMACGFGACFSCVVRVKLDDGEWDYRRTCVEGPVFPAESLVW